MICEQTIAKSDGRFAMAYDGSGDRQRSPICNVVLCNPKPVLGMCSHANRANLVDCICLGEYITSKFCEDTVRCADSLHTMIKNGKIRQRLQQKSSARRSPEKRLGVSSRGATRWTTRDEQFQNLLDLKSDLQDILMDDSKEGLEWQSYVSKTNQDIIKEWRFWANLKSNKKCIGYLTNMTTAFEKDTSLGEVYYRWSRALEHVGYVSDSSESSVASSESSESSIDERNQFLIDMMLEKWKLIYDPIHLEAFLLDVRYMNHNKVIKNHDINAYVEWLRSQCSSEDEYAALKDEFYKFRRMEREYQSENRGISVDSGAEANLRYWRGLSVRYAGNATMQRLVQRGMDRAKTPTGSESVECTFNAIKLVQTPQRASLGPKKLRKLVYLHNNYRLLKRF